MALDIAPSALARARAAGVPDGVELDRANVLEYDVRAHGPWDLVVFSETIYFLGWQYPMFDIAWLAFELHEATRPGGRLLVANTLGAEQDKLLQPWLIRTYRDLFLNVGYECEAERVVHGTKNDVEYDVLVTLFGKPPEASD